MVSRSILSAIVTSGANESGTLTVNNLSISAITSYGQFVARVRADGTAHWAYSGNDITFQRPEVVARRRRIGQPLQCRLRFHHLGNISLPVSRNSQTFLSGARRFNRFLYLGRQMPVGADPFSHLQPLAQHYLSRLSDGTIVLIGNQRATVDWGNGVVLSSGSSFSSTRHPLFPSCRWQCDPRTSSADRPDTILPIVAVGPANEVWFTSTVTDSATTTVPRQYR